MNLHDTYGNFDQNDCFLLQLHQLQQEFGGAVEPGSWVPKPDNKLGWFGWRSKHLSTVENKLGRQMPNWKYKPCDLAAPRRQRKRNASWCSAMRGRLAFSEAV